MPARKIPKYVVMNSRPLWAMSPIRVPRSKPLEIKPLATARTCQSTSLQVVIRSSVTTAGCRGRDSAAARTRSARLATTPEVLHMAHFASLQR